MVEIFFKARLFSDVESATALFLGQYFTCGFDTMKATCLQLQYIYGKRAFVQTFNMGNLMNFFRLMLSDQSLQTFLLKLDTFSL